MVSWRRFWALLNQPPLRDAPEDKAPRAVWRMFRQYFLRFHPVRLVLLMLLGGMVGSVSVYFYNWSAKFIADEVVQVRLAAGDGAPGAPKVALPPARPVEEKLRLLALLAAAVAAVLLLDNAGVWLVRQLNVVIGQNVRFRLRRHLYDKMHSLPMAYHDRHSPGYLMTHLFGDVETIERLMMQLSMNLPYSIAMIGVGMVILLRLDASLAALALAAVPAYAGCYRWFRRRLGTVNRNLREREGRLSAHMANRVENFLLVKSFGRETTEGIDFLRQARPIARDQVAAALLNTCFVVLCGVVTALCVVAVLWLGALRVRDGLMTPGQLLLFYGATGAMFKPAGELTQLAGALHRLRAVCTKVVRVLDEPVTLTDPAEPRAVPARPPEIRFERVTLRYDERRPPALRDVSFTLPAGKTLCVMGASGSGKTSLAKLACRLYDVTDGAVRMDGVDVRHFRLSELCQLVGYVNQEPVILDGTIEENIRYGSAEAGVQQVITASQLAQIHEFIERLPLRYRTLTQERGLSLSGGQKQRLNLARALLYAPKVLVLDDCTSALDAQTEARLVDAFESALRGRTTILVSHRMSMAMESDLVLVLADGRVAEFGPPAELLGRGGLFTRMYREQAKGIRLRGAHAGQQGAAAPHGASEVTAAEEPGRG